MAEEKSLAEMYLEAWGEAAWVERERMRLFEPERYALWAEQMGWEEPQ